MIKGIPIWIELLFAAACVVTLLLFYFSNGRPKKLTLGILLWSFVHSLLAFLGFYANTSTAPPRVVFIMFPLVFFVIYGLRPKQQKWFMQQRNPVFSSMLHIVRFPIELVLYGLFLEKMVPELMTFEGRNYDIIIGCTAPILSWLILKGRLGRVGQLVWNVVGLAMVLAVLVNGVLSAELPFQQFAFNQPNVAVLYFPFVLLPAMIIPIAIWTHLSDIIRLRAGIGEVDVL